LGLKIAAVGFLLVAVGLFTIPHDLGPGSLYRAASDGAAEHHGRALYGLLLIGVGLVLGIAGWMTGGGGRVEGGSEEMR
jgi:hypothetical protein